MRFVLPLTGLILASAIATPSAATSNFAAHRAETADPRVRQFDYRPGQVYRVVGVIGSATQILFGPGEVIQHVALGDGGGWEAAPDGEVLFLKPRSLGRATNLIVTTRRGGEGRHYVFELLARSGAIGRSTPETYFQVSFRYPEDVRDKLDVALASQAAILDQKVLQLKLQRGVLEGPRNLAYTLQGAEALAPSEVSDNGRFTVLRFAGQQALPTIYAVGEDGQDALIPFDVRGEFVVVHAVLRELRLRRGRAVLCIFNEAFNPNGQRPQSGTAASDVERVPLLGAQR
ncbi:MAG: TrbG/VirB9 family P-type conjugative transfer protein [Pseudomonadota bacterium]